MSSGSVNTAILIGNVGKDPESLRLQNGKPVVKFSLATSESWRDQNGERQERTTWHNIVIFSEGLCKITEQYVKKGSKVFIQGAISNRSYDNKDGQKVYVSEIVLQGFNSTLTLLDGKPDGDRQEQPSQSSQTRERQNYAAASGGHDLDDEIPF